MGDENRVLDVDDCDPNTFVRLPPGAPGCLAQFLSWKLNTDDGLDDYYACVDEDNEEGVEDDTWWEDSGLNDCQCTILVVPDLEHQVEQLHEELAAAKDSRDEWQRMSDELIRHRDRLLAFVRLLQEDLHGAQAERARQLTGLLTDTEPAPAYGRP
jgi:hypothetical protein